MKTKSAIRQMFNSEKGTFESVYMTAEHQKLLSEVVNFDDELRAKLSTKPELLKLYTKTNDTIEAMHCESEENHYVEGFKFGLLMGLEIATEKTDC